MAGSVWDLVAEGFAVGVCAVDGMLVGVAKADVDASAREVVVLDGGVGGGVKTEDFDLAEVKHRPEIHVLHGDGDDFIADTVEVNVEGGGVGGDGFREAEGLAVVGDAEVMLKCFFGAEGMVDGVVIEFVEVGDAVVLFKKVAEREVLDGPGEADVWGDTCVGGSVESGFVVLNPGGEDVGVGAQLSEEGQAVGDIFGGEGSKGGETKDVVVLVEVAEKAVCGLVGREAKREVVAGVVTGMESDGLREVGFLLAVAVGNVNGGVGVEVVAVLIFGE